MKIMEKEAKLLHKLNQAHEIKQQRILKKHLIRKKFALRRFRLYRALKENKNTIIQIVQLIGGIVYAIIRSFSG